MGLATSLSMIGAMLDGSAGVMSTSYLLYDSLRNRLRAMVERRTWTTINVQACSFSVTTIQIVQSPITVSSEVA